MLPTVAAYLLLALFFALEGALRKGQAAKSLEASSSDRGSTRWIAWAFLVSFLLLFLAPLLTYWEIGLIPANSNLAWLGILVMVFGLGLRVWSNRVLGQFYTRTLRTIEQQQIVQTGPYRYLRHPGYLGCLMMWTGAGLATFNWLVMALVLAVMLAAYCFRIAVEERMLLGTFGAKYEEYQRRTWRLVPLLF
jgi:protein-S-isoprenylcysteine O-methyltransferase